MLYDNSSSNFLFFEKCNALYGHIPYMPPRIKVFKKLKPEKPAPLAKVEGMKTYDTTNLPMAPKKYKDDEYTVDTNTQRTGLVGRKMDLDGNYNDVNHLTSAWNYSAWDAAPQTENSKSVFPATSENNGQIDQVTIDPFEMPRNYIADLGTLHTANVMQLYDGVNPMVHTGLINRGQVTSVN